MPDIYDPFSSLPLYQHLVFFFLVKREYINYELIKRKRVALDTSKVKASNPSKILGKEFSYQNQPHPTPLITIASY